MNCQRAGSGFQFQYQQAFQIASFHVSLMQNDLQGTLKPGVHVKVHFINAVIRGLNPFGPDSLDQWRKCANDKVSLLKLAKCACSHDPGIWWLEIALNQLDEPVNAKHILRVNPSLDMYAHRLIRLQRISSSCCKSLIVDC